MGCPTYTTFMPSLRWLVKTGKPKVFSIFKNATTVGHASGNDVELSAEGVARHHAQLVFDGRDFTLSEIDEQAEILINGKKKRRSRIEHQDRIQLGEAELVFSIFDEVSSAPAEQVGSPASEVSGLSKLQEFSERLMQIKAVPELLDALLDAVVEISHADKGFLVWIENGEPKVVAARNLQKESLPAGVRHLSDSIIASVIENKRPIIVSDALHDTQFSSSESVMNLKLSSVMCAPLIAQGQLLGVLYVGNDRVVRLFEESSLEVFRIFAAQASLILQNALLLNQVQADRDELRSRLTPASFGEIIGHAAGLLEVLRQVDKVANTDVSVIITGETGTGKELIARQIHRASPRAKGPFVVVNCGAIPENLMESEIFGHVRGAFTGAIATREGKFQAANGGTLFLDEIGELPLSLQVKLLRALQERVVTKVGDTKPEKVDIRVLAATHRNLAEEIRKGTFREDLYYRLNVVNLHLPSLRERGDDVLILAKAFVQRYAEELGSKVKGFTPNAVIAMKKYDWPGNIRQLENRVKKALVLCERTLIGPEDLDLFAEVLTPILPLAEAKEDFQRRYILEVLERNHGNRTKTARDLGVDPRTIFRYLERGPDASSSDE